MTVAQLTPIRSMLCEKPVILPGATPEDMRKGLDALGELAPRLAHVTAISVGAGGVNAEWLVPNIGSPNRVVLYLHGGGYVCGSVQSHRVLLEHLALATRCRVLALNYRLAPEHPFPAPVEDACSAYCWLVAQGYDPTQIAIAGDSAGGGLVFAAQIALRDAGGPLPAFAVAISPWTDMECLGDSMLTRAAVDPMVQKPAVEYMAQLYLKGAHPKSPLASPLYGDFRGLPPTLIQVGDAEVLLDDTTRIAPKLKADGVDLTVEIWPDMIHVWHFFAPMLDEGQAAIDRIGTFHSQAYWRSEYRAGQFYGDTPMTNLAEDSPVSRAREIGPILRRNAAAGEAARALTPEAHEALVSAGVFGLTRPRSLGGQEVDLLTFIRVVREIARADGSAGWCAMISGYYAAFGALLSRAGAEEVFSDETTVIAGAFRPNGFAKRVPGGYRVTGSWPFGSNSPHANWFIGAATVITDGRPELRPNGLPRFALTFVPRNQVMIEDTWTTTGLRATGSHDYTISDVFVPDFRTFWFSDEPCESGPLYALPTIAAAGAAIASVPVGIAEHALDLFAELAPRKKPIRSALTLQETATVHDRTGIALATVQAASAYLERVVSDAWSVVTQGRRLDWEQRGKLWLGATHAAQTSLHAIEQIYGLAGTAAIYASGEIDRCQRDARTAVQHVMTQYVNYETAGKQFLGLDIRDSSWGFDDRGDAP